MGQKNMTVALETRRAWVEPLHPTLSIRQQCALLELNRASYYYEPVPADPFELELMRQIDRQYLETPFYGGGDGLVEPIHPVVGAVQFAGRDLLSTRAPAGAGDSTKRLHQSLGYQTPAEVYAGKVRRFNISGQILSSENTIKSMHNRLSRCLYAGFVRFRKND
ncbi:MAG: hypothetical protein Fur005_08360 [Roseiflexaceae bacterium]